jgi:hypothetical protein
LQAQKDDSDESYSVVTERLHIDIKTAMSLAKASPVYHETLRKDLIESEDQDVKNFVGLISNRKPLSPRNLLMIASGEIAFSTILTFLGIVIMIPAFFAYANPKIIFKYFYTAGNSLLPNPLVSALIVIVNFVISVTMLLSAFQLLRLASEALKEGGLMASGAN